MECVAAALVDLEAPPFEVFYSYYCVPPAFFMFYYCCCNCGLVEDVFVVNAAGIANALREFVDLKNTFDDPELLLCAGLRALFKLVLVVVVGIK